MAAAEAFARQYAARVEEARLRAPAALTALSASRTQVLACQRDRLRQVLAHAQARSAFWRARLAAAGVTPEHADVEDLQRLPVLTKGEVLAHWDELSAVPGMTRAAAEAHLAALRDGRPDAGTAWTSPATGEQVMFFATGGSSGCRGFFAWDWDHLANSGLAHFRPLLADGVAAAGAAAPPARAAVVTAHDGVGACLHASTPLFAMVGAALPEGAEVRCFGAASRPFPELCRQLAADGGFTHVVGFSSVVARLAKEVRAGLDIGPVRAVFVNSEPVEDGAAESCRAAWGQSCAFHVGYGNVEGSVYAIQMLPARSRGDAAGDREPSFAMDVMDDHVVLARHPIDPQKSVITPLWSTTPPLPLINYAIDDICHFLDAPAQGNGVDTFPFQRVAIAGRKTDVVMHNQDSEQGPDVAAWITECDFSNACEEWHRLRDLVGTVAGTLDDVETPTSNGSVTWDQAFWVVLARTRDLEQRLHQANEGGRARRQDGSETPPECWLELEGLSEQATAVDIREFLGERFVAQLAAPPPFSKEESIVVIRGMKGKALLRFETSEAARQCCQQLDGGFVKGRKVSLVQLGLNPGYTGSAGDGTMQLDGGASVKALAAQGRAEAAVAELQDKATPTPKRLRYTKKAPGASSSFQQAQDAEQPARKLIQHVVLVLQSRQNDGQGPMPISDLEEDLPLNLQPAGDTDLGAVLQQFPQEVEVVGEGAQATVQLAQLAQTAAEMAEASPPASPARGSPRGRGRAFAEHIFQKKQWVDSNKAFLKEAAKEAQQGAPTEAPTTASAAASATEADIDKMWNDKRKRYHVQVHIAGTKFQNRFRADQRQHAIAFWQELQEARTAGDCDRAGKAEADFKIDQKVVA